MIVPKLISLPKLRLCLPRAKLFFVWLAGVFFALINYISKQLTDNGDYILHIVIYEAI